MAVNHQVAGSSPPVPQKCPCRLTVRTRDFHSRNPGSIPGGGTIRTGSSGVERRPEEPSVGGSNPSQSTVLVAYR